ncbi:MAG: electron transfer flavoprotein subunit alpha/FixB family protein [Candidatus Thermoplasmatota archaeon]
MRESRGVWVFMEQLERKLLPVGLELLGRGRELADTLHEPLIAVVFGHSLDVSIGEECIRRGADEAFIADHPFLETYLTDAYTKTMAALVQERKPNLLLVGSTPNGRDLAGRLAVRLRTGLTANAVRLDVDPKNKLLVAGVPGFGGSVLALIKCEHTRPQMSTVRPGVFRPRPSDPTRSGRVERVPVELKPSDERCAVMDRRLVALEDVGAAERSVVAGLGTGGDMKLINALADALGASIGVTRPLVDIGVSTRERQIGSTGIALRGKLAIVVGVSGASHFTSGLADVGTVIAINQDASAPIFEHADVCIVADLFELLPALMEELATKKEVTA